MKVIKAEPKRTASFAPGGPQVVMTSDGHIPRRAEPSEFVRSNNIDNAPIEKFDVRFIEAMQAKGWLK